MAYTKQTWTNGVSKLNATRMQHIEDGLEAAASTADTAEAALPAGAIMQYGGSSAPTGWLLCDGTAVSRTTYADLFTAISTAYGTGDGSTTFNLPDLQGRVAVGKGSHTDVDALGDSDGSALASRRPKHKHTVNETAHSHETTVDVVQGNAGNGTSGGTGFMGTGVDSVTTTSVSTGLTVGPQSSAPTDGPAYLVVNYIIKT